MWQFFAQHPVGQQRYKRERENQCADQGGSHAERHGLKNAPFMALQRKYRDMRCNDDEHRKQCWPADFVGGIDDDVFALVIGHVLFALSQTVQDVFNHDHRAVNDDAEIHCSQTEQVGWHTHDLQAQKC